MSYYKNLVPGQWQIGDIVMGRGTNIQVLTVDVKAYDINAQDYQVARADETRFGQDSFKPTTIELGMIVLHDYLLPGYEGSIPNFWHSQPTIQDLQREWRFDEGRNITGQMKPLFVNSKLDEVPKVIMGRPGQFTYTYDDMFDKGEVCQVTAEFRRGDTFAYGLPLNTVLLNQADPTATISGTAGEGPSWLITKILGPVNHPVLTFENLYNTTAPIVIDLDYNIAADEIVEINGEPWSRRVVNNEDPPLSLPAKLIGDTPYLDKLRFNFNASVNIELTGTGMNSDTLVAVQFRDTYQLI